MILGKVVGTVVSSTTNIGIAGARFLLVDKCDQHGIKKNDYLVALDLIGAGNDELVMISESSSARETMMTAAKPVDCIIIGIVDVIDENETIIYKK